jgi:nucleoside-triphosphatase THEP1
MEKPVSNTRLIRVEFLAKLFLAQLLGPEIVERIIGTQLEACQAQLTRLQKKASDEGFEHLIFHFRKGQIQAIIDWLRYCRRVFLSDTPTFRQTQDTTGEVENRMKNRGQVILLTGRRGVGKTTVCQTVAELARRRGYRPYGVITPAIYACPELALREVEGQSRRDSHGAKVGFEAVDVSSGERWPLARTDRELGGPCVGPYSFDPEGLSKALEVLITAAMEERDLLVIDEIGPLELEQGKGFAPILDLLPVEGPTHTLIVVRPTLLGQLLLHLRGNKFTIFSVTEGNRDELPSRIVEELWGMGTAVP